MLVSLGICSLTYSQGLKGAHFGYYSHPVDYHFSWLAFQASLGVAVSSGLLATGLITGGIGDLFCLLAYNTGY